MSAPPIPSTAVPSDPSSTTTSSPPTRPPGIFDAFRTIRPGDFTTFYQAPCAREALLTGIGAGFAMGGLRFAVLSKTPTTSTTNPSPNTRTTTVANTNTSTQPQADLSKRPAAQAAASTLNRTRKGNTFGARAWRSMTWAVLSFTLFSAGTHVFCQRRRSMERAAMARANEIVARKREEKRVEMRARKAEREQKRVEHEVEKSGWSRWGRWFGGNDSGAGVDNKDKGGRDPGAGV